MTKFVYLLWNTDERRVLLIASSLERAQQEFRQTWLFNGTWTFNADLDIWEDDDGEDYIERREVLQ